MKRIDYTALNGNELLTECGSDASKWAAAFMQHIGKRGGDFNEDIVMTWFANAIETAHAVKSRQQESNTPYMSASEAVFGFAAWLTTREEATVFGAAHDCGPIAKAVTEFNETNNLRSPRENWTDYLTHPKDK